MASWQSSLYSDSSLTSVWTDWSEGSLQTAASCCLTPKCLKCSSADRWCTSPVYSRQAFTPLSSLSEAWSPPAELRQVHRCRCCHLTSLDDDDDDDDYDDHEEQEEEGGVTGCACDKTTSRSRDSVETDRRPEPIVLRTIMDTVSAFMLSPIFPAPSTADVIQRKRMADLSQFVDEHSPMDSGEGHRHSDTCTGLPNTCLPLSRQTRNAAQTSTSTSSSACRAAVKKDSIGTSRTLSSRLKKMASKFRKRIRSSKCRIK